MPRPSPRTSSPILALSQLRIARGEKTLLPALDWRIQPGEHWAILGPNGCGKTSLLRALTGYLSPSSGEMDLLGQRYGDCDWRELRNVIGLVSSSLQTAIPSAEPAVETVVSGKYAQLDLWAKTTARDFTEARRLLRTVGAAALAEREWIFLSQGERQRVLFARALMARPRLLVLDEPCAGLDPIARELFLQTIATSIRRLAKLSLVLVTHHVEELIPEITHVLMLGPAGRVAAGPIREVMTAPNFRQAFGNDVALSHSSGRWSLTLARKS